MRHIKTVFQPTNQPRINLAHFSDRRRRSRMMHCACRCELTDIFSSHSKYIYTHQIASATLFVDVVVQIAFLSSGFLSRFVIDLRVRIHPPPDSLPFHITCTLGERVILCVHNVQLLEYVYKVMLCTQHALHLSTQHTHTPSNHSIPPKCHGGTRRKLCSVHIRHTIQIVRARALYVRAHFRWIESCGLCTIYLVRATCYYYACCTENLYYVWVHGCGISPLPATTKHIFHIFHLRHINISQTYVQHRPPVKLQRNYKSSGSGVVDR